VIQTSTRYQNNPASDVSQRSRRGGAEQRRSQCARVYAELRRWYPGECPLWALHDLKPRISDLTTRIWELRHTYHLGIENRMERDGGEVHSFYRLVRDSHEVAIAFGYPDMLPALDRLARETSIAQSRPIRELPPEHGSGSLFGDLSPESRYPD
jgi:hypothetical protein